MANLGEIFYSAGVKPNFKGLEKLEEKLKQAASTQYNIRVGVMYEFGDALSRFNGVSKGIEERAKETAENVQKHIREASRGNFNKDVLFDKRDNAAAQDLIETLKRVITTAEAAQYNLRSMRPMDVDSAIKGARSLLNYYSILGTEMNRLMDMNGGKQNSAFLKGFQAEVAATVNEVIPRLQAALSSLTTSKTAQEYKENIGKLQQALEQTGLSKKGTDISHLEGLFNALEKVRQKTDYVNAALGNTRNIINSMNPDMVTIPYAVVKTLKVTSGAVADMAKSINEQLSKNDIEISRFKVTGLKKVIEDIISTTRTAVAKTSLDMGTKSVEQTNDALKQQLDLLKQINTQISLKGLSAYNEQLANFQGLSSRKKAATLKELQENINFVEEAIAGRKAWMAENGENAEAQKKVEIYERLLAVYKEIQAATSGTKAPAVQQPVVPQADTAIESTLKKIGKLNEAFAEFAASGPNKQKGLRNTLNASITDTLNSIGSTANDLKPRTDALMQSIADGGYKGSEGLKTLKSELNEIIVEYNKLAQKINETTPKRSTGGWITGAGSAKSDSIMAMLSNGEFVVNAAMAKQFGPLLELINSGKLKDIQDALGKLAPKIDKATVEKQLEGLVLNGARLSQQSIDNIKQQILSAMGGAPSVQTFAAVPRRRIGFDTSGTMDAASTQRVIDAKKKEKEAIDAANKSRGETIKQEQTITHTVKGSTKATDDVEKDRQKFAKARLKITEEISRLETVQLGKNGGDVVQGRIEGLRMLQREFDKAGDSVARQVRVLDQYQTALANLRTESNIATNNQKRINAEAAEYARIEAAWAKSHATEPAEVTYRRRMQNELTEVFGAPYSEKLKQNNGPYMGFIGELAKEFQLPEYSSLIKSATDKYHELQAAMQTAKEQGKDTTYMDQALAKWANYIKTLEQFNGDIYTMLALLSQSKQMLSALGHDVTMARSGDARATVMQRNREGDFAADDRALAALRASADKRVQAMQATEDKIQKERERLNNALQTFMTAAPQIVGKSSVDVNTEKAKATIQKAIDQLDEIARKTLRSRDAAMNAAISTGTFDNARALAGKQYGRAISDARAEARRQEQQRRIADDEQGIISRYNSLAATVAGRISALQSEENKISAAGGSTANLNAVIDSYKTWKTEIDAAAGSLEKMNKILAESGARSGQLKGELSAAKTSDASVDQRAKALADANLAIQREREKLERELAAFQKPRQAGAEGFKVDINAEAAVQAVKNALNQLDAIASKAAEERIRAISDAMKSGLFDNARKAAGDLYRDATRSAGEDSKELKNIHKIHSRYRELETEVEAKIKELQAKADAATAKGRSTDNLKEVIEQYRAWAMEINILRNDLKLMNMVLDEAAGKRKALKSAEKGATALDNAASTTMGRSIEHAYRRGYDAQGKFLDQTRSTLNSIVSLDQQFSMMAMTIQNAFSIYALQQFLSKIIDIGGELERQQLAMGSIFGDSRLAESMYNKVAELSMRSPFTVQDLVKNTKQLSAFGVEYDQLYDTTRRLSDIAAGVGVDFGRIAYEYGQMEAMGFLDARHLRMFSMSGIPLAQQLAKHYTEERGVDVGVEEVRKMITKRQVGADVVKDILRDMTDEGGRFFNMQEIMAESLASKYANLTNAINLMYGRLAKGTVGGWLKDLATFLTDLAFNWEGLARQLGMGIASLAVVKSALMAQASLSMKAANAVARHALFQQGLTAAEVKSVATGEALVATKKTQVALAFKEVLANETLTTSQKRTLIATSALTKAQKTGALVYTGLSLAQARFVIGSGKAAAAAIRLRLALVGIGNFLMSNAWYLGAAAVSYVAVSLYNSYVEAHKLDKELLSISNKMNRDVSTLTNEFNRLLNKLKDARGNQEEYGKIIDQLNNTYSGYIGNLSREASAYDSVAAAANRAKLAIREKLREQALEDSITAIDESFDPKIDKAAKNLKSGIEKFLNKNKLNIDSDALTSTVMSSIQEGMTDQQIVDLLKAEYRGINPQKFLNQFFGIDEFAEGVISTRAASAYRDVWEQRQSKVESIYKGYNGVEYSTMIGQVDEYYKKQKEGAKNHNDELKIEKARLESIIKLLTKGGVQLGDTYVKGVKNAAKSTVDKYREQLKDVTRDLEQLWYTQAIDVFSNRTLGNNEKPSNSVYATVMSGVDSTDMLAFYKSLKKQKETAEKTVEEFEADFEHNRKDSESESRYSLAKETLTAIEEYAKLRGIDWAKIDATKGSGGKAEREYLKKIREDVDLLKKVQQAYNSVLSETGKNREAAWAEALESDAIKSLMNKYSRVFGGKDFAGKEGFRRFQNALFEFKKSIAASLNLKEVDDRNLGEEIDNLIRSWELSEAGDRIEKEFNEFTTRLDDIAKEWEYYRMLIEQGFDNRAASGIAFKTTTDYAGAYNAYDYISRMLDNALNAKGVNKGIDWRDLRNLGEGDVAEMMYGDAYRIMTKTMESGDDAAKASVRETYEAMKLNVKEVIELTKRLYAEDEKQRQSVKDAVKESVQSLSENVRYGMRRNAIMERYVELEKHATEEERKQLELMEASDLMKLDMDQWKANPLNTFAMNNLSEMTRSSLDSLVKSLGSIMSKYNLPESSEPMKAVRELQQKLYAEYMNQSLIPNVAEAAKAASEEGKLLVSARQRLAVARVRLATNKDSIDAQKEERQAVEEVENAEWRVYNAQQRLLASAQKLRDTIGTIGKILSDIGGIIDDDFGRVLSTLGNTLSDIPSIAENITKGGWSAVSGYVQGVVALYQLSNTLSDAVSNMDHAAYERAAARRREINAMTDAVYEYAKAVAEATAQERNWFGDTPLMNLHDFAEQYANAAKAYTSKLYESQEQYRNKKHGGWGNYMVAGLASAAVVAAAAMTGGAALGMLVPLLGEGGAIIATSAALGAAAGAVGAGLYGGAEAIYNAAKYAEGQVAAINNLIIETRSKSNGWAGIGWGGHDQQTQTLQSWLDEVETIYDAYLDYINGMSSAKAYENVARAQGHGWKEQKKFAEAMAEMGISNFDLFDEAGNLNLELAKAIIENEELSDKLQGDTKDTLEALIKYQEQMNEYHEKLQEVISDTYSPLLDAMTDAIWDWFDNGVDALTSFKKNAVDVFRDIATQMMQTLLLEHIFDKFKEDIFNLYDEYSLSKATDNPMTERELGKRMAPIAGGLVDAFGNVVPFMENLVTGLDSGLKKEGYDFGLGDKNTSGTSKSIAGMTEETADVLAAYMNGLRTDLAAQRNAVEYIAYSGLAALVGEMQASMGNSASMLEAAEVTAYDELPALNATAEAQLRQLNQQTEYLYQIRQSNDAIREDVYQLQADLHSVIYGTNKIRV